MAFGKTIATYTIYFKARIGTDEALRSSRRFATWTFSAGVVRLYAAYKIDSTELCKLAMWSYGIVAVHYIIEGLVFGIDDTRRKRALLVSLTSLVWMAACF